MTALPSRIFVATQAGGVYYTNNFVDPSIQPTWSAINTGLPTLDCLEFHVDPHNPNGRQYVLLDTNKTLYVRNGGDWSELVTVADLNAVLEPGFTNYIVSFIPDTVVENRIFLVVKSTLGSDARIYYCEVNSGEITVTVQIYRSTFGFVYGIGKIRGFGEGLFLNTSTGAGGMDAGTIFSQDRGRTWTLLPHNSMNYLGVIAHYPFQQFSCVANQYHSGGLVKVTTSTSELIADMSISRSDGMWFGSSVFHRVIDDKRIYRTTDEWLSVSASDVITPEPVCFSSYPFTDDITFLGLNVISSQPYVIGVLEYGDSVVSQISGANCTTAPFIDSIPYTCGTAAIGGIRAIPNDPTHGYVYTQSVKFET